MAENTAIEWCDATFNPWIGCARISPACDDCYAARSTPARTLGVAWGAGAARHRTSESYWKQPLKWNAKAAREGRRIRVFCASLADVFDNQVPMGWLDDLWRLIEATPQLDWLLLTKRIGNVNNMLPIPFDFAERYPHVWIGATVVNQAEADRDIPKLLATDAAVRFLSIEPMLGPIDLCSINPPQLNDGRAHAGANVLMNQPGLRRAIDWVICGGESGPNARPMHPDWARSLRDQCAAAGVPFLFKQWGEWTPGVNVKRRRGKVQTAELHEDGWHLYREDLARDDGHIDDEPDLYRVGKKEAGRLLDGVEHTGFPEVA
jgi:protein gp37